MNQVNNGISHLSKSKSLSRKATKKLIGDTFDEAKVIADIISVKRSKSVLKKPASKQNIQSEKNSSKYSRKSTNKHFENRIISPQLQNSPQKVTEVKIFAKIKRENH